MRRPASDFSVAIFRDGKFVLPVRCVTGCTPAVSLQDLVGLVCTDSDTTRNREVLNEVRDIVEHMLVLYPDIGTDTLVPSVPLATLSRVLRMLSVVIPSEVQQFRRSATPRWLLGVLGSDEELIRCVEVATDDMRETIHLNGPGVRPCVLLSWPKLAL